MHWGRGGLARSAVLSASGWHCLGPVLVVWAAGGVVWTRGVAGAGLRIWSLLVLAMLAQFAMDAATAVVRHACLRAPLACLRAPLRWSILVDAVLAPIGLSAALAAGPTAALIVFTAAPVLLMSLLERDRSHHLTADVEFSHAYDAEAIESRRDGLTGLANRRAWDEAAASMQARLGGDEFGILAPCPAGELAAAERLTAAIRAEVDAAEPVHGHRLSLSFGVRACEPAGDLMSAGRAADRAARADKRARRAARGAPTSS